MRLIKVNAPRGIGARVAQTAFAVGIENVSFYQTESLEANGKNEPRDTIDIETSTPNGKRFLDALVAADFYEPEKFSVAVRQPRAVLSSADLRDVTKPLVEPALDILEELWQFSHITYGFVGRFFIGACLLAYGLIQQQTLIIIAGLLFLPLLPLLLGIGFGAWTRNWRLVGQALAAFLVAALLLVAGGAAVGALTDPPIKYDEFSSLPVSFLISLAVGVAAALANIDDVGRRELIGLAATAQIAIIPVWFGAAAVLGFPATASASDITNRAIAFGMNSLTIIAASLAVYVLTGAAKGIWGRLKNK
jgi:hypothetical protein